MSLTLIIRLALRDWRAGELRLLLTSILIAVGTVTAISFFIDRLHQALVSESTTFLAADRVISGGQPIPDAFRSLAIENNLSVVETLVFPSMVFASTKSERNQLVSVKAVSDGYPLRGTLRTAEIPFGPSSPNNSLPALGEVWLDARLFPALDVKLGDLVSVGYQSLEIAGVLTSEPDRGGSIFDLGPRLLMLMQDVPNTQVVQPGSRIGYRLLLAGDEPSLDALYSSIAEDLRPNYRWQSIRESSPSIGRALERAESFLLLGGLLAVLLAGIAVALSAHRYAKRHYDHVGVLKTLGTTPQSIQAGYFGILGVLGIVGVGFGLALGLALHFGLVSILQTYMPIDLPLPGMKPVWLGFATGFVCLMAFALPPLLALKNISPMRVIRRDIETTVTSKALTYGFGAAGTIGLLIWYTGNLFLTTVTLAGGTAACLVFGILATLLLRGGRYVGMQAGSTWRLALAGLQRRYRENIAQIMIFGLAIMLLLILFLVRTSLIDEWRQQMPENTPNHFVMNVTPTEVNSVQTLLNQYSTYDGKLFPMFRGRISAVNDTPVTEYQRNFLYGERSGPRLSSERNLTWSRDLANNNRIVDGQWWNSDKEKFSDEALISVEQDYAETWGLNIGDQLTFDLGGVPFTASIANTRTVEWDSLQPNFFLMFSPGAIEKIPSTFMTSFHLEPDKKKFLNTLLTNHPTITVLEIDELIQQVQSIISRVTQAVELVLILVLGSGALVLVASIQASRDQRLKEHALIRTLGGTRRLIAGSLVSEFAILGTFAGIVAVFGAEMTVFILERQIFELPYQARPWIWLIGPLIGMCLVALVGYLGTRKLINTPPITVLREL